MLQISSGEFGEPRKEHQGAVGGCWQAVSSQIFQLLFEVANSFGVRTSYMQCTHFVYEVFFLKFLWILYIVNICLYLCSLFKLFSSLWKCSVGFPWSSNCLFRASHLSFFFPLSSYSTKCSCISLWWIKSYNSLYLTSFATDDILQHYKNYFYFVQSFLIK